MTGSPHYITNRGKQYDFEIDDSRPSDKYIGVYLRRVWVREVIDDQPQDDGQRSVFDIGLERFFGGQAYREMPEDLAQWCLRWVLEDGPPPPSPHVHRLIFTRKGLLKNPETGDVDKRFHEEKTGTIDSVILMLKKALKDTIEHKRRIGFHQADSEIFCWSRV